MIQVDEILNDPDLCESFQIIRKANGSFVVGGFQPSAPVTLPCYGAVRNTSGKELEMVPEADRIKNALTFRTTTQIFETNEANTQISDILVFHGDKYRVLAVKDYSQQGYYLAIAVIMGGS